MLTALALCLQLASVHGASNCQPLPTVQAPSGGIFGKFDWTVSKASFLTPDGSKAILVHATTASYAWALQQASQLERDTRGQGFDEESELSTFPPVKTGDPIMERSFSPYGHVIVEKFGVIGEGAADGQGPSLMLESAIDVWLFNLKTLCTPKNRSPCPTCVCVPLEGKTH
jgi:hypothetical protein